MISNARTAFLRCRAEISQWHGVGQAIFGSLISSLHIEVLTISLHDFQDRSCMVNRLLLAGSVS